MKSFIIFLKKGTWWGRGFCFVYPAINFAEVFRKVYAGTFDVGVFHVLLSIGNDILFYLKSHRFNLP